MADVRNTQSKNERFNALDALEDRLRPVGPEESRAEQSPRPQAEVQTGLTAEVPQTLQTAPAEALRTRHPGQAPRLTPSYAAPPFSRSALSA